MKTRFGFLLITGLLAAGCAGDKTAAEHATAQAAIDKIHAEYTTHFNLHHAGPVADLHSDSAVFLGADGSVDVGKPAILKGLEQTIAASPTLTLTPAETMFFEADRAITRGSYTIAMTPPGGAAVNLSGNYLTAFRRENGGWKISAVATNYDAPPPAGLPRDTVMSGEAPPQELGTLKDLVAAYAQHYNMGHAPVVAGLYTDSAYSAFADAPAKQGRPAIEAYLKEQVAQGSPQLAIHEVATSELPGGWAIDAGWYLVNASTPQGAASRAGAYMLLAQRQANNSWKIHWSLTNGGPVSASVK